MSAVPTDSRRFCPPDRRNGCTMALPSRPNRRRRSNAASRTSARQPLQPQAVDEFVVYVRDELMLGVLQEDPTAPCTACASDIDAVDPGRARHRPPAAIQRQQGSLRALAGRRSRRTARRHRCPCVQDRRARGGCAGRRPGHDRFRKQAGLRFGPGCGAEVSIRPAFGTERADAGAGCGGSGSRGAPAAARIRAADAGDAGRRMPARLPADAADPGRGSGARRPVGAGRAVGGLQRKRIQRPARRRAGDAAIVDTGYTTHGAELLGAARRTRPSTVLVGRTPGRRCGRALQDHAVGDADDGVEVVLHEQDRPVARGDPACRAPGAHLRLRLCSARRAPSTVPIASAQAIASCCLPARGTAGSGSRGAGPTARRGAGRLRRG